MGKFKIKSVAKRGKSAYQSWLDNGGVGSEADFVSSLAGRTGASGFDGVGFCVGQTGLFLAGSVPQHFVPLRTDGTPTPVDLILPASTIDFLSSHMGVVSAFPAVSPPIGFVYAVYVGVVRESVVDGNGNSAA